MFLRFFRFGVFAFEVGERHVQRLVPQADSDGVHRDPFFMQGVGIGLAEAVKLRALDASFLGNRLQFAQEVSVGFPISICEHQVMRLGVPLSHSVLDFPN